MTASPRVFLISEPPSMRNSSLGPDMRQLMSFGTIHIILSHADFPVMRSDQAVNKISQALQLYDYDPDVDYIAWAGGDPVALLLIGAYLGDMGYERVKWLRYTKPRDPLTGKTLIASPHEYIEVPPITILVPEDHEEIMNERQSTPA